MKKTSNQEFDNTEIEKEEIDEVAHDDNMSDEQPQDDADTATEAVDWQDQYVRMAAEFDNYRKRTLKEKMDLVQNGGADFIKAVLPVIDDFERALAAMQEGADRQGVALIYQNLLDALKSKGVVPIDAKGKEFDVDFHEAVAKIPATDECPSGVVFDEIQRGYMLRDRVLRFSKVVVTE